MFDTVRAQVGVELDPGQLKRKGFVYQREEREGAEGIPIVKEAYVWHGQDESPHFLKYIAPKRSDPDDPAGHLIVETSLPKVIYGENFSLLRPEDVSPCLDLVSERVSSTVGSPLPAFQEWSIRGRADVCFNWKTSHVSDYLHGIKGLHLSRHHTDGIDKDATVYIRNAQRVGRFYDKYRETSLDGAKDLLRFELQLNHSKAEFKRLVGSDSVRIGDVISWPRAEAVMSHYLESMGADLIIASEDKLLAHLIKTVGIKKAARLMGFAMLTSCYSREELLAKGMRKWNFCKSRRELQESGASGALVKSGVLPALTLPKTYTGDPGQLA